MQTVTLAGDKEFINKIRAIYDRAKNPTRAMQAVSNLMRRDVLKHFKDESDESGRWPDLKPATWKWKQAKGYSNMLQNTGDLRRNCLPDHTRNQAIVRNDLAYAGKQNSGKGSTPAREFMWLSKGVMEEIRYKMMSFIKDGI